MGESRSMLVCHGRPWDGRAISNDAATMAGRGERVRHCTDGGSHPLRTARNCGGRVDVGRGLNS